MSGKSKDAFRLPSIESKDRVRRLNNIHQKASGLKARLILYSSRKLELPASELDFVYDLIHRLPFDESVVQIRARAYVNAKKNQRARKGRDHKKKHRTNDFYTTYLLIHYKLAKNFVAATHTLLSFLLNALRNCNTTRLHHQLPEFGNFVFVTATSAANTGLN